EPDQPAGEHRSAHRRRRDRRPTLDISGPPSGNQRTHENLASAAPVHVVVRRPSSTSFKHLIPIYAFPGYILFYFIQEFIQHFLLLQIKIVINITGYSEKQVSIFNAAPLCNVS